MAEQNFLYALVIIFLFLGALYLVLIFLKQKISLKIPRQGSIKIHGYQKLDQKMAVALIEADNQKFLLYTSGQNIGCQRLSRNKAQA